MGIDLNLKVALIFAAVLGGVFFYRMEHPSTVLAADGIDANWDSMAQMSKMTGEPTVLLFTAEWCGSCQWLHQNVLSHADVKSELRRNYNFFKIDLTSPSESVQRHAEQVGVHGIPCLIRYDIDGRETDRTHGMSADEMITWLKAGEPKD